MADVDLRSFRSDIVAAGSDPYVYNIFGDVPATIIAPAVLFDNVTVKHGEERNEKLPYYPPPPPPPGTAAAQWLPFVILLEQSDPRAEVVKLADTPS